MGILRHRPRILPQGSSERRIYKPDYPLAKNPAIDAPIVLPFQNSAVNLGYHYPGPITLVQNGTGDIFAPDGLRNIADTLSHSWQPTTAIVSRFTGESTGLASCITIRRESVLQTFRHLYGWDISASVRANVWFRGTNNWDIKVASTGDTNVTLHQELTQPGTWTIVSAICPVLGQDYTKGTVVTTFYRHDDGFIYTYESSVFTWAGAQIQRLFFGGTSTDPLLVDDQVIQQWSFVNHSHDSTTAKVFTEDLARNVWSRLFVPANDTPFLYSVAGGGASTISAGFIADSETHYAPTLTPGAVSVSAGFITDNETHYAPTLTSGVTVSAGFIGDSTTVSAPTLTGVATVTVGFLADGTTVYAPTLDAPIGGNTIDAAYIASVSATYAPTITTGAVTVTAGFIGGATSVYAPSLNTAANIAAGFIADSETHYAPTVSPGAATVTAGFISSTSEIFAPSIPYTQTASVGFISAESALFDPTLRDPAALWIRVGAASTTWSSVAADDTTWTEI